MTLPPLAVVDLGRMAHATAHDIQRAVSGERIARRLDRDVLLLVEHEPTVTLGRGTRPESLPLAPDELRRRGLEVVELERGGDVTWHGPGQLVGYPILDLAGHRQDLHWYLRQVEEALILGLDRLGIVAGRNPGYTGVWTGGRKIASIGIHVRQWVTTHGFALNVINDLRGFELIIPCGIAGVEMTSVARETVGRPGGQAAEDRDLWERSAAAVVGAFGEIFARTPGASTLEAILPEGTAATLRAL